MNEFGQTMRIDIHPAVPDAAGEVEAAPPRGIGPKTARRRAARSGDYRRLLHSVYDGVLVTELDGVVKDFNARALHFLRCKEEDLGGISVLSLISGADSMLLETIHNTLRDHRYTLIEASCVRRDGSMFPAEIAVNRIDLDDTRQLCFFIRDITVRKRAERALEEMVDRLETLDRARSQFVSNVSHELLMA